MSDTMVLVSVSVIFGGIGLFKFASIGIGLVSVIWQNKNTCQKLNNFHQKMQYFDMFQHAKSKNLLSLTISDIVNVIVIFMKCELLETVLNNILSSLWDDPNELMNIKNL